MNRKIIVAVALALAAIPALAIATPPPRADQLCAGALKRDLDVGSTGADVTGLQFFLSARGFLEGEATGYFGTQTRAALAAYQASVGIAPAAGYLGPQTRAVMNAQICVTSAPASSTPPSAAALSGLTVTSPAPGAVWAIGSRATIGWRTTDVAPTTRGSISLVSATGATTTIGSNVKNDGSHTWKVASSVATGTYRVHVAMGRASSSVASVRIVDAAAASTSAAARRATACVNTGRASRCVVLPSSPVIRRATTTRATTTPEAQALTVTSLSESMTWVVGETRTFTWTTAGVPASARGRIVLTPAAGAPRTIGAVPNSGSYSWIVGQNGVAPGTYAVSIGMASATGTAAGTVTIAPAPIDPPPDDPPAAYRPTIDVDVPDSVTVGSTISVTWSITRSQPASSTDVRVSLQHKTKPVSGDDVVVPGGVGEHFGNGATLLPTAGLPAGAYRVVVCEVRPVGPEICVARDVSVNAPGRRYVSVGGRGGYRPNIPAFVAQAAANWSDEVLDGGRRFDRYDFVLAGGTAAKPVGRWELTFSCPANASAVVRGDVVHNVENACETPHTETIVTDSPGDVAMPFFFRRLDANAGTVTVTVKAYSAATGGALLGTKTITITLLVG